jgi:hypothetical protein
VGSRQTTETSIDSVQEILITPAILLFLGLCLGCRIEAPSGSALACGFVMVIIAQFWLNDYEIGHYGMTVDFWHNGIHNSYARTSFYSSTSYREGNQYELLEIC